MRIRHIPLQIVRSWILMLPVRTERANITWTIMNKSMPDHLVLSLESFATFTSCAAFHRTIVWSIL